jgi:hypothetical protein
MTLERWEGDEAMGQSDHLLFISFLKVRLSQTISPSSGVPLRCCNRTRKRQTDDTQTKTNRDEINKDRIQWITIIIFLGWRTGYIVLKFTLSLCFWLAFCNFPCRRCKLVVLGVGVQTALYYWRFLLRDQFYKFAGFISPFNKFGGWQSHQLSPKAWRFQICAELLMNYASSFYYLIWLLEVAPPPTLVPWPTGISLLTLVPRSTQYTSPPIPVLVGNSRTIQGSAAVSFILLSCFVVFVPFFILIIKTVEFEGRWCHEMKILTTSHWFCSPQSSTEQLCMGMCLPWRRS